ncbi:MAG: NTF2 fold immunity protein [Chthoniobacterales bacterium]
MIARFVIATLALLLSPLPMRAAKPLPGVGRTFGYIPDAAAAIRVAVMVWEPIYGKKHIASERPFQARLDGGVWHVRGSLPRAVAGGVAEADIRRSDGKVLRIMHGR